MNCCIVKMKLSLGIEILLKFGTAGLLILAITCKRVIVELKEFSFFTWLEDGTYCRRSIKFFFSHILRTWLELSKEYKVFRFSHGETWDQCLVGSHLKL